MRGACASTNRSKAASSPAAAAFTSRAFSRVMPSAAHAVHVVPFSWLDAVAARNVKRVGASWDIEGEDLVARNVRFVPFEQEGDLGAVA